MLVDRRDPSEPSFTFVYVCGGWPPCAILRGADTRGRGFRRAILPPRQRFFTHVKEGSQPREGFYAPCTTVKPTPRDVLNLLWCPRYLWFSKRLGVRVTPSMRRGRAEEEAIRRRLASILGGEPRPVYVDAGWAHGTVDILARRFSATPVEIKTGVPWSGHKWQLLAEAYLVKAGLGYAVHKAYLAYREEVRRLDVTPSDLAAAERLLSKAADVVEGPPPPPRRSARCRYCEFRALCP